MTVEATLVVYTLLRYKLNDLGRLIALTLAMLGTFQLAEYFVCTGYGVTAENWSRLGFAAITTLPPLGLHIMHHLAGKTGRRLVFASYATMAGFIAFFLTYNTAFIGHQCTGNYVIFQIGYKMGGLYGLYYYGLLATALVLGWRWAQQLQEKHGDKVRRQIESVKAMMVGYLVFLVPTALANTVKPETRAGIPSIMCGFAVLFALILALYIAPRQLVHKQSAPRAKKVA